MINLNFLISELIKSDIAIKNNINNMPDIRALDNILNLIVYCLQPIRDKLKKPMVITSGYRCLKVNQLAGGKSNSQHLTGEAADFHVPGMSVQETIEFIKRSGVDFDQLINEYDKWVHISYCKAGNRRSVFKIG